LRNAAGLADAIRDTFGITANLIEGHDGIYEVTVNSDIVYTNQGKCSGLPTTGEVLKEIGNFKAPLPGKKITMTEVFPMFLQKESR
jgi:hypothetical protein